MKTKIILLIAAILLLAIAVYVWATSSTGSGNENPSPMPQIPVLGSVQGTIADIAASAKVVTIQQGNSYVPIAIDSDTSIYDEGGRESDFTYLKKGFDIQVERKEGDQSEYIAKMIRVTRAPAIIIYEPVNGTIIQDPTITIKGVARVFENSFTVRIRTASSTIHEEPVMPYNGEMGKFGDFNYSFTLSKNVLPNENIYVDAFEYSAKDGSEINKATITLTIGHRQTTTVKAYFPNDKMDPGITCTVVYPVERVIAYTQTVGQAAITELLKGPIDKEPSYGFRTSVPTSTKLKSLKIENGTAYADFDENLDKGVGGSCRVSTIRAQITETLKQFPTVQSVVISVNGNSAEALQP